MKILLAGIVCFSFHSLGSPGFTVPSALVTLSAVVPAQGFSQCPPCSFDCIAIGFTWTLTPDTVDCSGEVSGQICEGEAEVTTPGIAQPGRDALISILVACRNPSGQTCAMLQSYRIERNVCCPQGQTKPHLACDGGQNGTGKCVSKNECGTSNCETIDQDCPCESGLSKPHYECIGPDCVSVNACGANECVPGGEPEFCDPGCTWSCEEQRCVGPGCESPIVIDTFGNGFELTSADSGVDFDIDGNGARERLAWTALNSDDGFLALDRNQNGSIDNGKELFGNFTPQPASPTRNGFAALAEFDDRARGGNGDGVIDAKDVVFFSLSLWQDRNHNGTAEGDEIHSVVSLGLSSIDLDYRESRRRDQHGNLFRYRSKVRDGRGAQIGRWAYDVFLVSP